MVEITHRSQLKNTDTKPLIHPDPHGNAVCSSSSNGIISTNCVPNKVDILSKLQNINKTVTVKQKILKLNSNSRQSKEINLHIEKQGRNIRCNILKPNQAAKENSSSVPVAGSSTCSRDIDGNAAKPKNTHETDSDSDAEGVNIYSHSIQQVKMEDELIINDDDNDDPMNEAGEGNEQNQELSDDSDDELNNRTFCKICHKNVSTLHLANHLAKLHNVCRFCNRIYSSYVELEMHLLRCSNRRKAKSRHIYCDLCKKHFLGIVKFTEHMKRNHDPKYKKHDKTELIRVANEAICKKWASLITDG